MIIKQIWSWQLIEKSAKIYIKINNTWIIGICQISNTLNLLLVK